MKIDPQHLPEFRNWMRTQLAAVVPVAEAADLVEAKALIEVVSRMMKSEQWPIIADIADRAESDVVDTVHFDEDEMLVLDDYEQPFYEKFLRERNTR